MRAKRLLIVDDEHEIVEMLSDELASPNLQILKATNGAEALATIRSLNPDQRLDAILSDLNMPKLSGIELLKTIRSDGLDTPVVFLTGYGDKDTAIEALKFGAFDFLEKPIDMEVLKTVVTDALALGSELGRIDEEVEALIRSKGLSHSEAETFRGAQRQLILLRKLRMSRLKQKAS